MNLFQFRIRLSLVSEQKMSQARGSYRGSVGRGAPVKNVASGPSQGSSRGRGKVQTRGGGRGRGGRQNVQQEAPQGFLQPVDSPQRDYGGYQGRSDQGTSQKSYVNRTKKSYKPVLTRRFFDVEIPRDTQFDLESVRTEKVWFIEIPRGNNDVKKVLRMYCTDEVANQVGQNFSVAEFDPPVADLEKGENMFTLVIPLSGILNSNGHIRRFMIENAVDSALQSIQHRFQTVKPGDLEVRVSIRRPNEDHPNWSGKVFINILDERVTPARVATLRELLNATEWQLDLNDISGFRIKMKCYYSSSYHGAEDVADTDVQVEE